MLRGFTRYAFDAYHMFFFSMHARLSTGSGHASNQLQHSGFKASAEAIAAPVSIIHTTLMLCMQALQCHWYPGAPQGSSARAMPQPVWHNDQLVVQHLRRVLRQFINGISMESP